MTNPIDTRSYPNECVGSFSYFINFRQKAAKREAKRREEEWVWRPA